MDDKSGALDALINLSKDLTVKGKPGGPVKDCKCACCGEPCSKCGDRDDDTVEDESGVEVELGD